MGILSPRNSGREVAHPTAERATWIVAPHLGRLLPLALDVAEDDLEATTYSVATGGLSQRQIGAVVFERPIPGPSLRSLLRILGAMLRPKPEA